MNLSMKSEKDNALLERKEVIGNLAFSGATPSNKELQEALGKKYNVPAEQVAVKHIFGDFGGITATFEAHVYKSKEQLLKIEPKRKEKKTEGAQAAAPAAK